MSRILVIEDEANMADFVTRALMQRGFAAESVSSGERGLELVEQRNYELVLLDLLLPKMDGVAVLRQALDVRPTLRVMVMSAISDVNTKVRCLDLGALDYLVKPVMLNELVARIRARLRYAANGPLEHSLNVGKVELDLTKRIVTVGQERRPLATREFLLLEYLMRHAGDVCTREELLEQVWGYTFDPGTNVVDVYIGRLRAKLGAEDIETVRSVGYCFVAA